MNLQLFLTDKEILYGMHLMATLGPGHCCACEGQLARNHYRVQTIGASGHFLTFQVCEPCRGDLYIAARARHPQATDKLGAPPAPLTEAETKLPTPKPINLGSIYAPPPGNSKLQLGSDPRGEAAPPIPNSEFRIPNFFGEEPDAL